MIIFPNLAASSAASGFQYYRTTDFSFSVPGQFLPFFSGTISDYSSTYSIAKRRPLDAPSSVVLTTALVNVSANMTAGQYKNATGGISSPAIITGTSGGFPIFYAYNLIVASDTDSVDITLEVVNGSAVNNITPPTITVSGKLIFYLAPF